MELPIKERAIQALSACGFNEIGRDGSGLRLFESPSTPELASFIAAILPTRDEVGA